MKSRAQPKPRPPGWKMTADQASLFWRLWSSACRYQGWDELSAAERDEKRHEVLARCGFGSIKEVNSTSGFDTVKDAIEELCGKVHNQADDAGERRRILARIGETLSDLGQAGYPEHSLNTILRNRFKIIPGVRAITDLDTVELLNLSKTLSARLSGWNQNLELARLLPSLFTTWTLYRAWPAPIFTIGTSPAHPRKTRCKEAATELHESFK